MKRTKKLIALIAAAVMVLSCSVSSFAAVVPGTSKEGKKTAEVFIQNESFTDVFFLTKNCLFATWNQSGKNVKMYVDGEYWNTLAAKDAEIPNVCGYNVDVYIQVTYVKGSGRIDYISMTPDEFVAVQAAAQAAQSVAQAALQGNSAPLNNQAAAPNLSDAQIKALWDQAVAIKQAYDSETNQKKKKELEKQFTEIMNQIPMK
ncbi:MAG: hypothetical protein K6A38_10015 [Lachnospiraceae bacterium]|nr:hypothetical protein [Lachnospiraceae bacterium]